MSEERQGDMTSASLPAGGEPGALHLHLWTHTWPTDDSGRERPERRCECGVVEVWVDHDDGHAGGHPHFCDENTGKVHKITAKLKNGKVIEVKQERLFP